jgi:hypothetical protein
MVKYGHYLPIFTPQNTFAREQQALSWYHHRKKLAIRQER